MSAPPIPELLRWMAEMPAAFRAEPEGFPNGTVRVRAVVSDLHDALVGAPPAEAVLAAFNVANPDKAERNRLRFVLAAAHLLWHPSFREDRPAKAALQRLLVQEIATLAGVVAVEQLDTEEERREELIRRTMRVLARPIPGEKPTESEDLFAQVDSVSRRRILLEAAERERRAREVREAMTRKAAEEAAAKVSRE